MIVDRGIAGGVTSGGPNNGPGPGNSITRNSITQEALDEIALSRAEYDRILELLDREPNAVELGMFGALWSEHCGYKHSRPL